MQYSEWLDIAMPRLIGDFSAHGDSYYDEKSLENLKYAEDVLCYIVEKLVENVNRGERSYEGSVQDIGKRSAEILKSMVEIS